MGVGIGTEIACILTGGLDTSGRILTNPREVVAERIGRRWYTIRGSLFWARTVGLGLRLLMNADLTPGRTRQIELEARQEALQEDGVTKATVTASLVRGVFTLQGAIELDSGLSFLLTADASGAAEVLFT